MLTAEDVRDAFYYVLGELPHRSVYYDGGVDKSKRKYTNKWERVVKFLNDKKCLDIYGYIYANLHFRPDLRTYGIKLQPTHLYSDAAWEAYLHYRNYLRETLYPSLLLQLQTILTRVTFWETSRPGEDPWRLTLQDDSISVSAILRYYFSKHFAYVDVMEKYRDRAEYEYLVAAQAYEACGLNLADDLGVRWLPVGAGGHGRDT